MLSWAFLENETENPYPPEENININSSWEALVDCNQRVYNEDSRNIQWYMFSNLGWIQTMAETQQPDEAAEWPG